MARAPKGDPASIQAKWLRNIQAATPDVQAGIARVSQAPGQAAAAQRQTWQNNVLAAGDKWERNVKAVSLADWQTAATAGVQRIAQGAQTKQDKVGRHLAAYLPYLAQGMAKVDAMPKGTLEQNLARMVTMVRHSAAYKRPGS